jgi:hypothetical protein
MSPVGPAPQTEGEARMRTERAETANRCLNANPNCLPRQYPMNPLFPF